MEDIIRAFFWQSAAGKLDHFDFETAFNTAEHYLRDKLAAHGLLTLEDFREIDEECLCASAKDLEEFAVQTDYIYISSDELFDVIMEYRYKRFHEEFEDYGAFKELKELYDKIQCTDDLSTSEKAILFDEVIHAQHVTGDIFEDFNVETIKADVDREYTMMANGEI